MFGTRGVDFASAHEVEFGFHTRLHCAFNSRVVISFVLMYSHVLYSHVFSTMFEAYRNTQASSSHSRVDFFDHVRVEFEFKSKLACSLFFKNMEVVISVVPAQLQALFFYAALVLCPRACFFLVCISLSTSDSHLKPSRNFRLRSRVVHAVLGSRFF